MNNNNIKILKVLLLKHFYFQIIFKFLPVQKPGLLAYISQSCWSWKTAQIKINLLLNAGRESYKNWTPFKKNDQKP